MKYYIQHEKYEDGRKKIDEPNVSNSESAFTILQGEYYCSTHISNNCYSGKNGIFIQINSDDQYCHSIFCQECWKALGQEIKQAIKEN